MPDIDLLEEAFKKTGVPYRRYTPSDTDGGETAEVIQIPEVKFQFTMAGAFIGTVALVDGDFEPRVVVL